MPRSFNTLSKPKYGIIKSNYVRKNQKNPWIDENQYIDLPSKAYAIYYIGVVNAPYSSVSIGYHTPNDPAY